MKSLKAMAEALDGHELNRFDDVVQEFQAEAAAAGQVIVFGASDDLMELRGAIYDEIGACDADGVVAWIASGQLLRSECDDDDCPYFARLRNNARMKIRAYWCAEDADGLAWTYRLPLDTPSSTFTIFEDGEPWCRGVVFTLPTGAP